MIYMAEVITQIPGYEKGTVQTVAAQKKERVVVFLVKIVSVIRDKQLEKSVQNEFKYGNNQDQRKN